MPKRIKRETRLLRLADELREKARTAALPGYAEQLIRAAETLEKRAFECELRLVADN